jgi:hypothetical protein
MIGTYSLPITGSSSARPPIWEAWMCTRMAELRLKNL